MKDLKCMEKCLIEYVEPQLQRLSEVDAQELGEAIDMIKDLEEAIYYHTITESMKGQAEWVKTDEGWLKEEGRSHKSRKMYMEAKQMHHDKTTQLHELEKYMKELSEDIIDMIEDATQEEKELLSTKLQGLAARIDS